MGKVDEAIGQFALALKLEPGPRQAHNNLGNALFRKGASARASPNMKQPSRATGHAALLNNLAGSSRLVPRPRSETDHGRLNWRRKLGSSRAEKSMVLGTLAAAYAEAGRFRRQSLPRGKQWIWPPPRVKPRRPTCSARVWRFTSRHPIP